MRNWHLVAVTSSSYLGRKEQRRLWQLNHLLDLPGLESSKYMLRWLLPFFLLPQDKWVGAFSSTQRFCSVELKAFLTSTTKKQSAQWSWCCQQNTNCFELLALSLFQRSITVETFLTVRSLQKCLLELYRVEERRVKKEVVRWRPLVLI